MHAFFNPPFVQVIFLPETTPSNASHNLTYLPAYLSTPTIKNSSDVRETGSKQDSSPSHSGRKTHNVKGNVNVSKRRGKGKGSKAGQLPAFDCVWGAHTGVRELNTCPHRLYCCFNSTRHQSWGRGVDAEREGYVESSTWHAQSIMGVYHSAWLHTSFPCLDSHQSYDSENTGRCTEQSCV